jgi:hypothetical protein
VILLFALAILVGEILIQFGPETAHHAMYFCDPGTIAMVAAPMVVGALMPKPGTPQYNQPQGMNTFPEYQRKLLESGFNPQSELYRVAGEQSAAQTNRQLARRGLGNTGLGMSTQTAAANDLANKFLSSETQRRALAYEKAVAPETAAYSGRVKSAENQYAADQAAYNNEIAGRDRFLGGVGSIAGQIGTYGGQNGWFSGGGATGSALPGTYNYSGMPIGAGAGGYGSIA